MLCQGIFQEVNKLQTQFLLFWHWMPVDGYNVTTIEGLSQGDKLRPLQKHFVEKGAVQCGFCSQGMILAAKISLIKTHYQQKKL